MRFILYRINFILHWMKFISYRMNWSFYCVYNCFTAYTTVIRPKTRYWGALKLRRASNSRELTPDEQRKVCQNRIITDGIPLLYSLCNFHTAHTIIIQPIWLLCSLSTSYTAYILSTCYTAYMNRLRRAPQSQELTPDDSRKVAIKRSLSSYTSILGEIWL